MALAVGVTALAVVAQHIDLVAHRTAVAVTAGFAHVALVADVVLGFRMQTEQRLPSSSSVRFILFVPLRFAAGRHGAGRPRVAYSLLIHGHGVAILVVGFTSPKQLLGPVFGLQGGLLGVRNFL